MMIYALNGRNGDQDLGTFRIDQWPTAQLLQHRANFVAGRVHRTGRPAPSVQATIEQIDIVLLAREIGITL